MGAYGIKATKKGIEARYPLAEDWSGVSWEIQTTPNPESAWVGPGLYDVSCVSVSSCTAVGAFVPAEEEGYYTESNFVEHWNGSSWEEQAVPNPANGYWNSLGSIACVATTCMTVGEFAYRNIKGAALYADYSSGGTNWELQLPVTPPHPGVHGGAELRGASCPAVTTCFAAGSAYDSTQGQVLPLLERAELHTE